MRGGGDDVTRGQTWGARRRRGGGRGTHRVKLPPWHINCISYGCRSFKYIPGQPSFNPAPRPLMMQTVM